MDAILLAALCLTNTCPNPHSCRSPARPPAGAAHAGVGASQLFLRTGRGHRTEAKVGVGTRRPDAGDEEAPRAHQSACSPARPPGRASPRRPSPPEDAVGLARPPLALAHAPGPPRAHVLNPRRPRLPPAVASADACIAPRSNSSAGRAGERRPSPSQNNKFRSPLPVPPEFIKHVLPLKPCRVPRCALAVRFLASRRATGLLFSSAARALAQSCDLKKSRSSFFFSLSSPRGPARQVLPGSEGTRG